MRLIVAFFGVGGILGCAASNTVARDLPAMPCARDSAVLQGRVSDIDRGCVAVEVQQAIGDWQPVTANDGAIILDGSVRPGDVVRGRLGRVYSYDHEFHIGDSVACLGTNWDGILNLEMMPIEDDRVRIVRGPREFEASLEDLAAPDCESRLQLAEQAAVANRESMADETQAQEAPAIPSCLPALSAP